MERLRSQPFTSSTPEDRKRDAGTASTTPGWPVSRKRSAGAGHPCGPGKGQVCQGGSAQCVLPLLRLPWKVLSVSGEVEQASPARVRGLFCRNRPISAFFLSTGFCGESVASAEPPPHPPPPAPPPQLVEQVVFLSGCRFRGP